MKKVVEGFKTFGKKLNKKYMTATAMASVALVSVAGSAFAAPSTGNVDVDSMLTEMEGGFGTARSSFVYLALAAIPVTLIVVLFFWLRGKFKQSVSGA